MNLQISKISLPQHPNRLPYRIVATLLAAVLVSFAAAPAAAQVSVIVELDEPPAAVWVAERRAAGTPTDDDQLAARRAALASGHDAFLAGLDAAGIGYQVEQARIPGYDGAVTGVDHRYTLVFNGVALSVAPDAVAAIEARPGVKRVHPNRVYRPTLARSVDYVRARQLYGAVQELGPFDDLREGFEGHGIDIAIIDTGIVWEHEMFGGDPTPPRHGLAQAVAAVPTNDKVVYYLSLMENLIDDYGHGTHVAATAAGYLGLAPGPDGIPLTADDEEVHGVAPQANLMGYKVCSGVGSASGTIGCLGTSILLALEDAVSPRTLTGFIKPVAEVINLSLGGPGGPDDSTATAASNAALMGAIVVAAAGNSGPADGTLDSPGAGRHVIAVAASNDWGVYPHALDPQPAGGVDPGVPTIPGTLAPDSNGGLGFTEPIVGRYVFAGFADTPDQVPVSMVGNICLVERGSTATVADQGSGLFLVKAANCQAKGAVAMVLFNDVPGEIGPILAPAAIPIFTISRAAGLVLRDELGFDATGLSRFPLRLGPPDPALFEGQIAGFSSRGPVVGFGQVKPDVSAPGVDVMAATTRIGVPALSMVDASGYTPASGTSMATPHVAGAAALLKQAHPEWGPEMVRAALINAATNLRDRQGVPAPAGPEGAAINDQGGGLVDVAAAADAAAVMGVAGDGISAPLFLASHSFGRVPVVGSRVEHTETVGVSLLDLSGAGGAWTLAVENNRDLQLAGISATVSPAQVVVGADGAAGFELAVTVDGDLVRESTVAKPVGGATVVEPLQVQGYVVATSSSGESLRMPFYLKPIRSLPLEVSSTVVDTFEGILPAGDTGAELVEDVTYVDHQVEVASAAFQIDALLEFTNVAGLPDLDLLLLDPDGEVIASSTTAGGPEQLSGDVLELGAYTLRVVGWANGPTPYTLTVTQLLGGDPPALAPIVGEYTDSAGVAYDFDGSFELSWTPDGGELAFEVERSLDGGESWQVIAELDGGATSLALVDQPAGAQSFRVRGLHAGRIGYFVTVPSNVETVVVDRRDRVHITPHVETAISNVSFTGGIFQLDLRLTNAAKHGKTYHPTVELAVVKIQSASGTVKVANADHGGDGTSNKDAAFFDYSQQLGDDQAFTSGETTGARTLRFHDPAAELFTFRIKVWAHQGGSGSSSGGGSGGDESAPEPGSEPSDPVTEVLELTANPLTGTVTIQLVDGLP